VPVDEKIESLHQFYKWFGSLEQEDSGGNEANRLYFEELGTHIQTCKELMDSVVHIEGFLHDIETQYHVVGVKTDELHHMCEGLVLEEVTLLFLLSSKS